ncbi:Bacterial membrane protein YfhO [compost metagenome]
MTSDSNRPDRERERGPAWRPSPSLSWFVLVWIAMWVPALAQGRLLAPADGMAIYYPFRVVAAAAMKSGELPFWNPFQFGGFPLLAALQSGAFFPGNWGFWVLPGPVAMNLAVALAYGVAGLGVLGLARALGMGHAGAAIAAIAFAFGGFMVAHLEHVGMIQAASLLPAMLWAIERYRQTDGEGRYARWAALLLALQILAGHPQMVVLSLMVVGAYALCRGAGGTHGGRYAIGLLAAGAIAVGLCLAQLLPAFGLIAESQRQGFAYEALVAESLPPRQLISLWMPFLFGAPPSGPFPTPPWGAGPWYNEIIGYVGVVTLGLAAVGASRWRKEPSTRFWTGLALVALLLALGGATPLYQLWAELPLLKSLRAPGRHLLEFDLAVAMLAGYGLTALARGAVSRRTALGAWGAVGLPLLAVTAGIALAGGTLAARLQPFMPPEVDLASALSVAQAAVWLPLALWLVGGALLAAALTSRRRAWMGGLVAVVAADLWMFGQFQGWRQLSPRAADVPAPPIEAPWRGRTLALAVGDYPYRDFERVAALQAPGYGALVGARMTNGYDAFIKTRYARLMGGMTHGGALTDPAIWSDGHHGLDLLATRYVRLERGLWDDPAWRDRLAGARWRQLGGDRGVVVVENRRALPRAWRPSEALVLPAEQVDARVMGAGPFDPRRTALVEAPLGVDRLAAGSVEVTSSSPNRLEVRTDGTGPGLVVISEGYDAGWQAWLSGRRLPVHRVDGLLIGLEVPAGAHSVSLRYEPPFWGVGLAGSGLAALAWGGWAWRDRRRRRGGGASPDAG